MNRQLPPLAAGEDMLLLQNPDRGFRMGVEVDIRGESGVPYADARREIGWESDKMRPHDIPVTVAQAYMYLSGFCDRDIPEGGLRAIEAYFDALVSRGMKVQPRFIYSHAMPDALNDAPQAIILRHIDQLAPVIAKWKHAINAFQMCFIGAWGEWHGAYYDMDRGLIARAVMEKLVVPNGLYAQMRLPRYKNLLADTPYYRSIGIENDSFFGKIPDRGYGTGGLDAGTEQWDQLMREAAYAPQDGELYWHFWFEQNPGMTVHAADALRQLSEHRFSTLSILHSYFDACIVNGDAGKSVMGRWMEEKISKDWLDENGVLYAPAWFQDREGRPARRTVFEFVRDYLGYRLEAQSVDVRGGLCPGGAVEVEMPLVNHGFAAAFNLSATLALLDDTGCPVSEESCGEPASWYSRSPEDYADSRPLVHTARARLRLPDEAGRYRLAFRLGNTLGQTARLANCLEIENGYHILWTFTI
jgi:periplasmic beta-glucosidase